MGLIHSPLFVDAVEARLPALTDMDVSRLLHASKLSA
jgi:hypothetical protein